MKTLAAFLALFLIAGGARAEDQTPVSMIQLISTPERYHGKLVRLTAFLRVEFEGNGLYLHQEDYERHISRNGIWIDIPPQSIANAKELNLGYVVAVGTFDAQDKGHKGAWSGSLNQVIRLEKWRTEK